MICTYSPHTFLPLPHFSASTWTVSLCFYLACVYDFIHGQMEQGPSTWEGHPSSWPWTLQDLLKGLFCSWLLGPKRFLGSNFPASLLLLCCTLSLRVHLPFSFCHTSPLLLHIPAASWPSRPRLHWWGQWMDRLISHISHTGLGKPHDAPRHCLSTSHVCCHSKSGHDTPSATPQHTPEARPWYSGVLLQWKGLCLRELYYLESVRIMALLPAHPMELSSFGPWDRHMAWETPVLVALSPNLDI